MTIKQTASKPKATTKMKVARPKPRLNLWDMTHDQAMAAYVKGFTVPKEIPKGKVLVHNQVAHTTRSRTAVNGFRAWFQDRTEDIEPCKCGWAGLPHYRVKGIPIASPSTRK
jgi:hypothetical protein